MDLGPPRASTTPTGQAQFPVSATPAPTASSSQGAIRNPYEACHGLGSVSVLF